VVAAITVDLALVAAWCLTDAVGRGGMASRGSCRATFQETAMPLCVVTNREIVERSIEEVWNACDVVAIDDFYAEDFTTPSMPPPFPATREGLKRWITYYHSAFSNVSLTSDDIVVEGDRVALRWTSRGTHTGEFMGIPPTWRSFEIQGITIMRLVDGRIAEDWTQSDTLTMMRQLGILEPLMRLSS
jgi:steroid delta-isomerase-like uncharacterized protein